MRIDLGLDRPVVVQFAKFVGRVVQGDLGISYRNQRPVAQLLGERLPATLELVLVATVLALSLGIPEPERRLGAYPHQLSGGQRQRVVIAAALSCGPKLLVADEPTTALDVSVQAQILRLIRQLVDERQLGVLLVTHNMGVVAEIADTVSIMLQGRMVETGPVARVLAAPEHPYARTLIAAVPRLDRRLERMPVPREETPVAVKARAAVRDRATREGIAAAEGPLLEVRNLTVDFNAGGWLPGSTRRGFRAVDGVSFEVRPGEIFGLIGESGCGKTTVANVIAGLIRPTGGRCCSRAGGFR